MDDFSGRLRRLREDAELTQRELAERCGVSFQAVQAWEQGAREPGFGSMQKLAAGLKVSVEQLTTTGPVRPPREPGRPAKPPLKPVPPQAGRFVPVVGTVGAGPPMDERLSGVTAFVPDQIAGEVVGYEVVGDSMLADLIAHGDHVLVREDPVPKSGELVVAWVEEPAGMVMKRIKARGGAMWLVSDDGYAHRLGDADKVYGTYVGLNRRVKQPNGHRR